MKDSMIGLLLLAALGCGGAIVYQKASYGKGTAQRIGIAFDVLHTRTQVEIDEKTIENDLLEQEIARRQGKHYDQTILSAARVKLLADVQAQTAARDAAAAVVPEDLTTEWIEGGLGILCIIAALTLAQLRPKQAAAPAVA